jgi:hypothetical protein
LAELKSMLNMGTDDLTEGSVEPAAPVGDAVPDQFSTPALAASAPPPPAEPTVEVVDEAEVPEAAKDQDQAGKA